MLLHLDGRIIWLTIYVQAYNALFCQTCDTFARSSDAVFELSTRFAIPFKLAGGLTDDQALAARRAVFLELTQVCLWGNSTDLSLLIDVSRTGHGSLSVY